MKAALEPLLPRDILYRAKQGFTSDLAPLFRREAARVRGLLLGPVMLDSDLFDENAIEALLDQHESGRSDHAQLIWLLLAFEGFLVTLRGALAARPLHAPASQAA